jgi:hypothetical protein
MLSPVVTIFALRGIGEPITIAAEKRIMRSPAL